MQLENAGTRYEEVCAEGMQFLLWDVYLFA